MNCETALYRHFDADDGLLYVGISLNYLNRLGDHRKGSPWFRLIARTTVEWFQSREEALEAERAAIMVEAPQCNVIHNRSHRLVADEPAEDLGPMPWGPVGWPLYEGQQPCPPDVQRIIYAKYLSAQATTASSAAGH